ncbi:MAG: cytochrome P450 [Actinomycetes bacterium]
MESPAAASGPVLDPFEPGFFDDPYPQYARLRSEAPVHRTPFGPWALSRYDDCIRLLRDPGTSVEVGNADDARRERIFAPDDPRDDRGTHAILNLDPPDHTRIRRLVQKAFTPRQVEALHARIDHLVEAALDRVAPTGGMDVITDLAFPLPFEVISDLLGMPDTDREQIRDVAHTLAGVLEPLTPPEAADSLRAASDAMTHHVEAAIAWKRDRPADDLLSALVAVEDDGDVLSPGELRDQVTLLYIAGHETTVNLIGNAMATLLRHPDQLQRLRDDPTLVNNAVEELLRFDGPVQFSRRILLTDLEVGGQALSAGTFVFTLLGAANHDPDHFGPDAESLDLGRRLAPQHLAFGGGIHHCLGAVLARAEARAALGALVARFPGLALATGTDPLAWNGRLVLRGLDTLPVTFG